MGLLKLNRKISGSTLVETLVGTAIIVILFAIATLTLNRVFGNVIKNNTLKIDNQIYKLQYLHQHHKIKLPYQDDFGDWEILMQEERIDNQTSIEIKAKNTRTEKTRIVTYLYETIEP